MIPIIVNELKQRKWSIFWWTLGVVALIVLTMSFYPTIKSQTPQLDKSFGNLSPQVTALFSDTGDFFSPVGYLSSQIFYVLLPLLLSILSIGLGASLIGREEQAHTLELLLARPVSRNRIVAGKALAGMCVLGIVGGIGIVASVIAAYAAHLTVGLGNIAWAGLICTLLSAIFGSLAFAISTGTRRARLASTGLAALVALLGYITTSFEGFLHWMRWPARLLPYHYYHPADILRGHAAWATAGWFIIAIIVLGALAMLGFRKRDIQ